MSEILLFIQKGCPFCRRALEWQRQLMAEQPLFSELQIKIIDELEEGSLAAQYDYYYVPTYFVNGKKLHEGTATKEKIEKVLRAALGEQQKEAIR